jgi:hypothetical protein
MNNLSHTVNYILSLENVFLLNCALWLISIHWNQPASYLVLAKWGRINSPLFRKLRMLPLISWGRGSTFLAIVTSSSIWFVSWIIDSVHWFCNMHMGKFHNFQFLLRCYREIQPIPFDRETTCVRKTRWAVQNWPFLGSNDNVSKGRDCSCIYRNVSDKQERPLLSKRKAHFAKQKMY